MRFYCALPTLTNATSYLITGSSGFVGRYLCVQLQASSNKVATLSRTGEISQKSGGQHWQIDLLAQTLPAELLSGVDVVVHLAGLAHQPAARRNNPQPYFDLNRDATLKLAKAASERGVKKFLFVSSVKAARYDRSVEPNDETISTLPDDAYGLSKRQAEQALLELPPTGMEIVIVRPSLVYGAGVKGNLHSMLHGIRRGWFPTISGGGIRSMVSVHDLCTALISLATVDKVANATFIVTDGEGYSVERISMAMRAAFAKRGAGVRLSEQHLRRLAALNNSVKRRLGVALPINTVIAKLCDSECYSSAHLQQELNWRPQHTLEDQLPAMVRNLSVRRE